MGDYPHISYLDEFFENADKDARFYYVSLRNHFYDYRNTANGLHHQKDQLTEKYETLKEDFEELREENKYYHQRNLELENEVAYLRYELQRLPEILKNFASGEVQRIFNA